VYGTDKKEGRGGREGRNEKGYKKAEEFRKYLDGERSARDPRFDLKVFQYVSSSSSSSSSSTSSSPSLLLSYTFITHTIFPSSLPPFSHTVSLRNMLIGSWILTGCPEMQWSSTGYGIEIRDISAVSLILSSTCVISKWS